MGLEILGIDLFGDPVLTRREGPGRPVVVWNKTTSDIILLGFVRGWTIKRVAETVKLSQPTLRRVYFSECAKRQIAADLFDMSQLVKLNAAADSGNVTARRELMRRMDVLRMRDSAKADQSPRPSKALALGKKEIAQLAALEQTELYEPPPPPMQLN